MDAIGAVGFDAALTLTENLDTIGQRLGTIQGTGVSRRDDKHLDLRRLPHISKTDRFVLLAERTAEQFIWFVGELRQQGRALLRIVSGLFLTRHVDHP